MKKKVFTSLVPIGCMFEADDIIYIGIDIKNNPELNKEQEQENVRQ